MMNADAMYFMDGILIEKANNNKCILKKVEKHILWTQVFLI